MNDASRFAARSYVRKESRVDRTLESLSDRLRQVPVAWPEAEASQPVEEVLLVIGGNAALIGGGVEGIRYATTVTPAAVYDPNVTTVYPAGLGYGVLFRDGVRQSGNVLIRHDFYGNPWSVPQGSLLRVSGTAQLVYDPGSGPVTMTAYTFDWI